MKAEELMLGDYVRDKHGHFVKVKEIYSDSIFTEDGEYEGEQLMVGEFEPIPIIEEILEKNGFQSFKHGQIWKERIGMGGQTTSATSPIEVIIYEGGHSVIINPHEGKEFQGYIGSVHELQRVLRICGIEKEINVN